MYFVPKEYLKLEDLSSPGPDTAVMTVPILQALSYAKKQGALCIGVTNTVGSEIARSTHCGVHLNAGCEIGVASTKAYTSTIIAIIMMALALSEDSIQKRPLRDRIIDQLSQLPDKIREVCVREGETSM